MTTMNMKKMRVPVVFLFLAVMVSKPDQILGNLQKTELNRKHHQDGQDEANMVSMLGAAFEEGHRENREMEVSSHRGAVKKSSATSVVDVCASEECTKSPISVPTAKPQDSAPTEAPMVSTSSVLETIYTFSDEENEAVTEIRGRIAAMEEAHASAQAEYAEMEEEYKALTEENGALKKQLGLAEPEA